MHSSLACLGDKFVVLLSVVVKVLAVGSVSASVVVVVVVISLAKQAPGRCICNGDSEGLEKVS